MLLGEGGDSFDWFFLAMAHWQLGDPVRRPATWYDRAVERMEKSETQDVELRRFRAEVAALFGLADLPADVFARP